jgi:hypothetical protein
MKRSNHELKMTISNDDFQITLLQNSFENSLGDHSFPTACESVVARLNIQTQLGVARNE